MKMRPAHRSDEPWIRSLIPRLFGFGPPPYRPMAAMEEAEADATTAAIGSDGDRIVIVATDDSGRRVGFIHLETSADFFTHERHGHISTIVVSADAEGRGVGRALLEAGEAWCRERGYRLLTLNVFERNEAARRLYERAGFGVDLVKYIKEVGSAEL